MNKSSVEFGRSMIEMLGVLAIIAVLSIMGFYGFSQALAKYKINKTIDQIIRISVRTRTMFVAQPNYSSMGSEPEEVNPVLVNTGIVQRDMMARDSTGKIKEPYEFVNAFKGRVTMRVGDKYYMGDRGGFILHYDSIPRLVCIDVATHAWGQNESGFIAMTINQPMPKGINLNNCESSPATQERKAMHCYNNRVMLKEAAVRACRYERHNYIEFLFY